MDLRTQAVDMEEEEARLQVLKDIQMDSEVEEVIAITEEVVHLSTSQELGLTLVTPLPAVQVLLGRDHAVVGELGVTQVEEAQEERD